MALLACWDLTNCVGTTLFAFCIFPSEAVRVAAASLTLCRFVAVFARLKLDFTPLTGTYWKDEGGALWEGFMEDIGVEGEYMR